MPARLAASTFSLMPPTGSTLPDSVISPVIATSPRTGRRVSSETSAVAMVTPADGPSFGIAPEGTCTWISDALKKSGSMLHCAAWARTHDSAARADSFITSPSWPVSVSDARAAHPRGLDEEHVAADRRPGQADGHARPLGALRHLLVEELRRAEELVDDRRRDPHRLGLRLRRRRRATLRQIAPISRSRLRTPASRV